MKLFATLAVAAVSAVVPLAAGAAPPPREAFPLPNVYVLRGALSGYVPARAGVDGSVSIKVTAVGPGAGYALYKSLTLRVTATTKLALSDGRIDDGEAGLVRVTSIAPISTLQALQAAAVDSIVDSLRVVAPPPAGR